MIAQYTYILSSNATISQDMSNPCSWTFRPRIRLMNLQRSPLSLKADLPVGFPYRFNSSFIIIILIKMKSLNRIFFLGIDAMGLFWSMQPETGFEKKRFMQLDVTNPLVSKVSIYNQFQSMDALHSAKLTPILQTAIPRWYKAQSVTRVEICENKLRGVLFIPSGKH